MKNMKKKVVIVATMVLLLAAVLLMSMSTFAKYTSTATTDAQTATVAKWGLTLQADATNLFSANYGAADNTTKLAATSSSTGVNVAAASAVVAPGTTGSMTFTVAGTADVSAQVKFALNMTSEIALDDYKPVKWTLNNGTSNVVTNGTVADINNYFNTNAEDLTITAGSVVDAKTYTLTWSWAFDNASVTVGSLNGNQADALLGQAATGASVAGHTAVTEMAFTISANFEQTQTVASAG